VISLSDQSCLTAFERYNMPKDITVNIDKRSGELREGLYNALERAVLDSLDDNGGASSGPIVDVGAGRGELIRRLTKKNLECFGIDPEIDCVQSASKHGRCVQGGIEDLHTLLEGQTPRVIVCSHVLEHLNSPFNAIRVMHESNAPELVLAVPNVLRSARLMRAMFGKRRGDHPEHVYAWGHAEFQSLIERAGYSPVEWYVDRVTMNPFSNRVGGFLTTKLKSIENNTLPRLHPTLSSSLILRCRRKH